MTERWLGPYALYTGWTWRWTRTAGTGVSTGVCWKKLASEHTSFTFSAIWLNSIWFYLVFAANVLDVLRLVIRQPCAHNPVAFRPVRMPCRTPGLVFFCIFPNRSCQGMKKFFCRIWLKKFFKFFAISNTLTNQCRFWSLIAIFMFAITLALLFWLLLLASGTPCSEYLFWI